MRKAAALLLALMMLAGCGGPASSSPASAPVTQGGGELSGPGPEALEDTYYDYTTYAFASETEGEYDPARYRWDRDGTLTFQEQNRLHTLSPENELLETVTIPEEHLAADTCYQFIWGDKYLLAVAADPSRLGVAYFTEDGGVQLSGVTLFDHQGQVVRQYDTVDKTRTTGYRILYDGGVPQVHWLDGETAIFNCRSHIILYDFAADTGRVLDDMSALEEEHGKFFVYYGASIDHCGVMDGSFYYMPRRTEEESIHGGTIWRADKNGAVELFDGRKFTHLLVKNGVLIAIEHPSLYGNDPDIVYTIDPGMLELREVWRGSAPIHFMESGWYLTFQSTHGWENDVLYAYHRDTGELFQHDLERIVQVNDLWVAEIEGSLRYYYTTFVEGTETDWVYDTASDTTTQLPDGSVGGILSVRPDGGRILRQHPDGSRRLQVACWPS